MELSVIIVNYNVRHFLEQCLFSVQEALKGIDGEVIVIDNSSTDQSIEQLSPAFPSARFIANKSNSGFAKACNQGFAVSKGRHVLFLNPDTILPEDCFRSCLSFFSSTPAAGALGVKMIDGTGTFLKESKRAFPSPLTSLYKLSGLASLFPGSPVFSRYHLGHLDMNETNEVDVLAGAFMMIKREVLETTGVFDEAFFMYGEDIDLSYRIQQAGYRNYYYAGTTIIHFKGESTKKTTVNYVRMFYRAMSIFVRKHYGGRKAGTFNLFIQLAIVIRAIFSATGTFIRQVGLPLIDAGLILLSFWLAKIGWNDYVRTDIHYPDHLLWIWFPVYTIFFMVVAWYAGLYDRWYSLPELARSSAISTILLLAAYGLLPEEYRFSRGIILTGAILSFLLIALIRVLLVRTGLPGRKINKAQGVPTIIAGSEEEYTNVISLLGQAGANEKILGRIAVSETIQPVLGQVNRLEEVIQKVPCCTIVFCQGDLTFKNIIHNISLLPRRISASIHSKGSTSIVGSDSKDETGLAVSANNSLKLANPYNKRLKRLIDIILAVTGIILFPLHLLIVKKPFSFFGHAFAVITGKRTWIGYARPVKSLPSLRKGIFASNGVLVEKQQLPADSLQMMDYWYARDYQPSVDLKLIWNIYRHLGG